MIYRKFCFFISALLAFTFISPGVVVFAASNGIIEGDILSGIAFGVIIVILIQYLIFFLAIRERTYLYFIFYIIAQAGIVFSMAGFSVEYLWSGSIFPLPGYYPVILSCLMIPVFLFRLDYLQLKYMLPRVRFAFIVLIALFPLAGSLGLILNGNAMISIVHVLAIIAWIFSVAATVLRLRQGFVPARFLLAGGILLSVGYAMYIFMYSGILPAHWVFRHFIKAGFLAEAVMMFYGTATRINYIEREKTAVREEAGRNLEKSGRIMDEFLSNMTHELKTPLHRIIGIAESMRLSDNLHGEDGKNLGLIASNGRRLMKLVSDILDYSHMRSEDPEIIKKTFDIAVTAQNVIDLLSSFTAGKPLVLANCVQKGLYRAYADEERIGRVLQTFVANAIKFTESGRVEISAAAADACDMLTVTVKNTGIGMPAGIDGKIFFSFEQADGSVAREFGSTGLGLAICKRIIELHGGRIWIEPAAGNSSLFSFTIPVSMQKERIRDSYAPDGKINEPYPLVPEYESCEISESIVGSPSILIVDDDHVNLAVLNHLLSGQECSVTIADDGLKAVSMIEERRKSRRGGERFFDLVLLDVIMPRVSGLDVLRRIRKDLSAEELPVILLTARTDRTDIDMAFSYGANDYILKPFSVHELFKRINNVLGSGSTIHEDVFKLSDRGNEYVFRSGEVLYFSADGKHTVVHTADRDYDLSVLMKDIESILPSCFMRIHRKYIINSSHISKVSHYSGGRYMVLLDDSDDTSLVASRSAVPALRDIADKK